MDGRATNDLIRTAAAGGGFRLSAARGTNDLIGIAAAASQHGARIVICGAGNTQTDDLIRIAAAGKGCVSFE